MLKSESFRWVNGLSVPGILVTDTEFTIHVWNLWLENHSGRIAGGMIGQNLFEAYPDLSIRCLDRYYRDALAGKVSVLSQGLHGYLLPMPPYLKDSPFEQMQQSVQIGPLFDGESVIGTITLIEDVTERTAEERELMQLLTDEKALRAEAESANRAKDEFLATLSHELRTPLNAIIGWAEILSNRHKDEATVLRAAQIITRNAKQQASIVEDLLDVSRIISGKLQLEVRPVDLVSVINAAMDAVRLSGDAKGISFQLMLNRMDTPVAGDADRLQQVMWNLLSNAVKFTPAGGRVTIGLETIESYAQITVADTGEGISPEFLPYLFDRFRQADGTTTRRHSGLGLGLALVRHLVELHGGTVEASSAGIGQGARFIVRLPVVGECPQSGHGRQDFLHRKDTAYSEDVPALAGLKILVVDDDDDSRELLAVLLETQGASVRGCYMVSEALEIIDAWAPDVLMSDIGMPDEDGYDLIRQVRAREREKGGSLPALALTGYAAIADEEQTLAAGYQMHLVKPIELRVLKEAIITVVGKSVIK